MISPTISPLLLTTLLSLVKYQIFELSRAFQAEIKPSVWPSALSFALSASDAFGFSFSDSYLKILPLAGTVRSPAAVLTLLPSAVTTI